MPRFYGPGSSFATASTGATGGGTSETFTANSLIYMSPLPRDTTSTTGVAFRRFLPQFLYLGYAPVGAVLDFVEVHVNAFNGPSTVTLTGLGIFRSENGPNRQTTQTLFAVAASLTSVVDLPSAGGNVILRAGPFSATLFTAAHLWGGIFSSHAGNSPTVVQRADDFNEGWIRNGATLAFGTNFTSTNSYHTTLEPVESRVGSFPGTIGAGQCPDIRLRLFTGLS